MMSIMNRIDMINYVGKEYLTQNIENGEYSYQQVLEEKIIGH